MDKAIVSAGNGVHAIAIVVSVLQPFTSSQVTLEKLEFLDELWPFIFIIFSGAKNYGATDGEQRETIYKIYGSPKSYAKDFKNLLDKVDKQFMMLESTETSQDYRSTKLMEFLRWLIAFTMLTKGFIPKHCSDKLLNLIRTEKRHTKRVQVDNSWMRWNR